MNKLKLVVSVGIAAACVLFAGCKKAAHSTSGKEPVSTSGDPVELKVKWKTGKRYEQQMTMSRTNLMKFPGSDKPQVIRDGSTEEYAVSALKDLPDGGTKLEFTILREKFDGMGMARTSFDSNQDPQQDGGNPVAPVLRSMVGAKFTCELDGNGDVGDVAGVDEFFARLPSRDPQTLNMIKQILNADMLKQRVMQERDLPKTPVKIGEQWPVQREVAAGPVGKLLINSKFTFKGWQQHEGRKCALLEFVGNYTTKPGSTPPGPVTVTVEKGEMSGSTWLDTDLQMVIGNAIDQKMTLKIVAQGRTFDGDMTQRIDSKLLNVTDVGK